MDISFSTFAALLGAAIGGLTSGLASWVTHRIQVRTQWLAQDTLRRQELYKEFIEAAAKRYAGALQHEQPGIPAWVELYAKTTPVVAKSRRPGRAKSDKKSSILISNRTRPSLSSGT